jgi:hypothetical protein
MILHILSNAENDDAKGHFFCLSAIKFPKFALTSGVKTREMNPVPQTRADDVGPPKELVVAQFENSWRYMVVFGVCVCGK